MDDAGHVVLDGRGLTIDQVVSVARGASRVRVSASARALVTASRQVVVAAVDAGNPRYGINTGFGSLSRTTVSRGDLDALQLNLVRSHAAGVGAPLPDDVVRASMMLLAGSLSRGFSGVSADLVESVVAMLNARIIPMVPEVGSVGASGDLAPLAHVALCLVGEGLARVDGQGEWVPAAAALASRGLRPFTLGPKEGLALINGTHLMAARAALAMHDARRLFDAALAAAAMSIDACRATDAFLDARVYEARGHPGPARVAASLRALLSASEILPSHRVDDPRVQDPYSLRCMAPVLGAALDALEVVLAATDRELTAVTDNPLVFASSPQIVSAGNFHGMPIAIPLDLLAIAVAHVAGISERRTFQMLAAADPESHLAPYLSPKPGLHSGLMIAQYTAAACCNEIIGLCAPASPINISTSAGMEDYNSFGPRAGAKAARALDLAASVIGIELMCAAEGLDRHRPLRSGGLIERIHALVRQHVAPFVADRPPAPDLAALRALVTSGEITAAMGSASLWSDGAA